MNIIEKLQTILSDNNITTDQFASGYFDNDFKDQIEKVLGPMKFIHCERTVGGGDWDGAQSVYYFTDHDTYISVEGSYHSEMGMNFEYDNWFVVEPVEVKTIEYWRVKS